MAPSRRGPPSVLLYCDNVAVTFLQSQPQLTPQQTRWQQTLSEYNYKLIHVPGKDNVAADALIRRSDHLRLALDSPPHPMLDTIRLAIPVDVKYQALLVKCVADPSDLLREFNIRDGLLFTQPRTRSAKPSVYIPVSP